MKTANTIAERDELQNIILAVAQPDGSWLCYEEGETIPLKYQPTGKDKLVSLFIGYEEALQIFFNEVAQQKRYRDMDRVFVYAGFPNEWQTEARAYAEWVARCNALYYRLVDGVNDNTMGLPTIASFIADLPAMAWPDQQQKDTNAID